MKIIEWIFLDGEIRGFSLIIVYLLPTLCFGVCMEMVLMSRLEGVAAKHAVPVALMKSRLRGEIWMPFAGCLTLFTLILMAEPASQILEDRRTASEVLRLLDEARDLEQRGRYLDSDGSDAFAAYERISQLRPWNPTTEKKRELFAWKLQEQAGQLYSSERMPELENLLALMEARNVGQVWATQFRQDRYRVQVYHGRGSRLQLDPNRVLMVFSMDAYTIRCGEDFGTFNKPGHVAFWPSEGTVVFEGGNAIQVFVLNGSVRPADRLKLISPLSGWGHKWSPVIAVRGREPGVSLLEEQEASGNTGRPSPGPRKATVPKTENKVRPIISYRCYLSRNDRFNTKGTDLRTVWNIKPQDILLQERYHYHRGNRDSLDRDDGVRGSDWLKQLRRHFSKELLPGSDPAATRAILRGEQPELEVKIYDNGIMLKLIRDI